MVPPAGLEPTRLAPEASALSTELRGHKSNIAVEARHNNKREALCAAELGRKLKFYQEAFKKMLEL